MGDLTKLPKSSALKRKSIPPKVFLIAGHEYDVDEEPSHKKVGFDLTAPSASTLKKDETKNAKGGIKAGVITVLDPTTPFEVYGRELHNYKTSISTVTGLKKWLLVCALLQLIGIITTLVVWVRVYFVWPLAFASKFLPGSVIFRSKYFALLFGLEPLYNLVFLIWAIVRPRKMIRLYCQIAFWLLICLLFNAINSIYFLSQLSLTSVTKQLQMTQGSYFLKHDVVDDMVDAENPIHEDDKTAKIGWDALQNYVIPHHFKCCGAENYLEWGQVNNVDNEGTPESCCSRPGCADKDPAEVDRTNKWQIGCAMKAFDLCQDVGSLVFVVTFLLMLISGLTIFLAHKYYVLIRKAEDPRFHVSGKEFWSDMFCLNCSSFRKLFNGRRTRKIAPVPNITNDTGPSPGPGQGAQSLGSGVNRRKNSNNAKDDVDEVAVLFHHKRDIIK